MKHLFFLGIAGHAMGGLALAAKNRGYLVGGLDEAAGPPMSDWLDDHGLTWAREYDAKQMKGVDAVVVSGQHGHDHHPVIEAARAQGIRILSYAELIGELTLDKRVIAISGTHGKTTTTAFIAWLFESAGRQPDYLIGIKPFNFDASSRLAGSDVLIVEADEYKASTLDSRSKFEYYHPDVLLITSIEHDHPDVFPDLQSVIDRFEAVVKNLPADGRLIAWADHDTVRDVAALAPCRVETYSLEAGDYTARNIAYLPAGIEFELETPNGVLGHLAVPLYGRHNVLNSLAAVATALGEGISFDQILTGAASFRGASRRFNIISQPGAAVTIVDDYAHHPTEVKATIEAAKLHFHKQRLIVIFRPHTYSRTQALLKEYSQSFDQADIIYITDVEPAREAANQRTVSGGEIIDGLPESLRPNAVFESDRSKLVEDVIAHAEPNDVILCMSVSGYQNLAEELADATKSAV